METQAKTHSGGGTLELEDDSCVPVFFCWSACLFQDTLKTARKMRSVAMAFRGTLSRESHVLVQPLPLKTMDSSVLRTVET